MKASSPTALKERASKRLRNLNNMKGVPSLGMIRDLYCFMKEVCMRLEEQEKELKECQNKTTATIN